MRLLPSKAAAGIAMRASGKGFETSSNEYMNQTNDTINGKDLQDASNRTFLAHSTFNTSHTYTPKGLTIAHRTLDVSHVYTSAGANESASYVPAFADDVQSHRNKYADRRPAGNTITELKHDDIIHQDQRPSESPRTSPCTYLSYPPSSETHSHRLSVSAGTRPDGVCKKATRKRHREVPLRRGLWTQEEDEILKRRVEHFKGRRWRQIAEEIKGRTGKQARERWINQLAPGVKKDSRWSREEDEKLAVYHARYHNKWSFIASHLPGRTDNNTKNRYNSTLRRRILDGEFDDLLIRHNLPAGSRARANAAHSNYGSNVYSAGACSSIEGGRESHGKQTKQCNSIGSTSTAQCELPNSNAPSSSSGRQNLLSLIPISQGNVSHAEGPVHEGLETAELYCASATSPVRTSSAQAVGGNSKCIAVLDPTYNNSATNYGEIMHPGFAHGENSWISRVDNASHGPLPSFKSVLLRSGAETSPQGGKNMQCMVAGASLDLVDVPRRFPELTLGPSHETMSKPAGRRISVGELCHGN